MTAPVAPDDTIAPRAIRTVLLLEDDAGNAAIAREALRIFAGAEVHHAPTIADAERVLRRHDVDLALVDLGLPDGSGITMLRRLAGTAHDRGTPPPVLVTWTVFDDDTHLFAALAAGAQGYLLKGDPPERLRDRLLAAAAGEPVISPSIARRVLAFFRGESRAGVAVLAKGREERDGVTLTTRERAVLELVAQGHTVGETAEALGVSDNTVKTHIKGAYLKLGVGTRVEAVDAARRLGLLSRP